MQGVSGEESSYQACRESLRVIIETTPLSRPGADRGLGRYARAVLTAAEHEHFRVRTRSLRVRSGRTQYIRDLVDRQRHLLANNYDVFHATNPYTSAAYTRGRNVVSVLDLIPLELPDYQQSGFNARLFLQKLVPRAERILALSQFTADRVAAVLNVPRDRLVVASLPPADSFRPSSREDHGGLLARFGICDPFVVSVADGRIHDPRKRLHWLPAIGKTLRRAGVQLVVAGPESERLLGAGGDLLTVGRLSDTDLARLFGAARALVFTSAYEGQGMPPLEAMACGTPVVAMRNSAIEEVVGDGGILIDERRRHEPLAIEELAAACVAAGRDDGERRMLGERAIRQSRRFTLPAFAKAVAHAYLG